MMDYSKHSDGGQKSPRDDPPPPLPPPPARQAHGGTPGHWNTGLFECFNDIPNCTVGI